MRSINEERNVITQLKREGTLLGCPACYSKYTLRQKFISLNSISVSNHRTHVRGILHKDQEKPY